jgi:hypothetical protein
MCASGLDEESARLFVDGERRLTKWNPNSPLLFSLQGYCYCDLLLAKGEWTVARDRASQTLGGAKSRHVLVDIALDPLTLSRAHLGIALTNVAAQPPIATAGDDALCCARKSPRGR